MSRGGGYRDSILTKILLEEGYYLKGNDPNVLRRAKPSGVRPNQVSLRQYSLIMNRILKDIIFFCKDKKRTLKIHMINIFSV